MKNKNNQQAKSLGDGGTSFLSLYTDNLLSFIFEMRETGMAVSVNSIIVKASQFSREFRKSLTQQGTQLCINSSMCMVSCIRWGHTYPNVNPLKWKRLPLILYVSPMRSYKCVAGMRPISLTWTRHLSLFHMIQKNIELVGQRTIHIRKSTSDTKCATCALTVTASGKMITPLFVFKGKN